MTMVFPCNECGKPTGTSSHPDRWLCADCGRTPEEVAPEKRSFAVEPGLTDEDVYKALMQMAADKRIVNEPVKAVFRRAAELIAAAQGGAPAPAPDRKLMPLEEAQRKHVRSMLDAGVDPDSMQGTMLRASFLAGFKVGRGE